MAKKIITGYREMTDEVKRRAHKAVDELFEVYDNEQGGIYLNWQLAVIIEVHEETNKA